MVVAARRWMPLPAPSRGFPVPAAGVLETVHTDLAVRATLGLLPRETDAAVGRRRLRPTLLGRLTSRGDRTESPVASWNEGLPTWRTAACEIACCEPAKCSARLFLSTKQWTSDHDAEERERLSVLADVKHNPTGALLWAMEQLTGKKTSDVIREMNEKETIPVDETVVREPAHRAQDRVGRNDACPCGKREEIQEVLYAEVELPSCSAPLDR